MLKAILLVTLSLIWLDFVSGLCRDVTIDECSYSTGPFETIKGENFFYLPTNHRVYMLLVVLLYFDTMPKC